MIPEWIRRVQDEIGNTVDPQTGKSRDYILDIPFGPELVRELSVWSRAVATWIDSCKRCEEDYMWLLGDESELKPEEARGVLINDVSTTIHMCGFVEDWRHWFDLRAEDKTGKAHPNVKALAVPLMAEFKRLGYID